MRLCKVLRVNRSTYYKHFHSAPSPRTVENQALRQLIWSEYMASNKRLSAAKMTIVLSRNHDIHISSGRVYRLMKSMNLPKMATSKPNFLYKKPSVSLSYPNELNQQFNPTQPNRAWVSDITYISVKNKFVYLCVVLDLFSRKVIGWKVSTRMTTSLVVDTLTQAIQHRQPTQPVLMHSDRGSQYTSLVYRQFLDTHQLVPSYSKPGYPYDNAVMEAFFKYIKKEELDRRQFHSMEEVVLSTFEYIEGWYNSKRPHSHNQMLTPNEREIQFFPS